MFFVLRVDISRSKYDSYFLFETINNYLAHLNHPNSDGMNNGYNSNVLVFMLNDLRDIEGIDNALYNLGCSILLYEKEKSNGLG